MLRRLAYLSVIFSCLIVSSSANSEEYGNWSLKYFVDEFGDKTDNKYIIISDRDGSFSNSATQGSLLYVRMLIDSRYIDEPYFKLYEYGGGNPLKGYYSDGHRYTCSVKNSQGVKSSIYLFLADDTNFLDIQTNNKLKSIFLEWVEKEGQVKFACFNQERKIEKYLFKLDFTGYNEAMSALKK
tara:strand:- start:518 stop:1066 length:549 start_codon:yes stop_codon:yes gene_type:complete